MRRIAIIINEREMLRAGYVNFAPSLSLLPELSNYSLEVFDASNIEQLFSSGSNSISKFDGLFIGTNATSDLIVSEKLHEQKAAISAFIQAGNGLFVGSQKKLSVEEKVFNGSEGLTGFLPDGYEFRTVQRPKSEKDSGIGQVSFADKNEQPTLASANLLFEHPRKIDADEIQKRCEDNRFKRHVYRSHLDPLSSGNYAPWLVDNSYKTSADVNPNNARNLLMVSANPLRNTRIVITTIVLDWAFHESVLINIIRYIAEGDPYVAFIGSEKTESDKDFEYLISAAKLQKVAFVKYPAVEEIGPNFLAIHNTFIFAKMWDSSSIYAFWKRLQLGKSNNVRRLSEYKQIFSFNKMGDTFGLNRISDRSSFDLVIDQAVLWIISKFEGRMWGGSFWTSSDVLDMLLDLDIPADAYLPSVIADIMQHNSDGSYDGVMSSTCGMLDLFLRLRATNHKILEQLGVDKTQIERTIAWIVKNLDAQSTYELQTAALALARLNHPEQAIPNTDGTIGIREKANAILSEHAETNALEISKKLSLAVRYGGKLNDHARLLNALEERQNPDGSWAGPKQTSFVLVLLLSDVVSFLDVSLLAKADDLIFQGIAYLRSIYDPVSGCWENDIQTTANAVHALGLFNRRYGYSSQDFSENIGLQSDVLTHLSGVEDALDALSNMRVELDNMRANLDSSNSRLSDALSKNEQTTQNLDRFKQHQKKLERHAHRSRFLSAIFGSLLLGILISLEIYHGGVLKAIVKEMGSIMAIFVSAVAGLSIAQLTKSPKREDDEPA